METDGLGAPGLEAQEEERQAELDPVDAQSIMLTWLRSATECLS